MGPPPAAAAGAIRQMHGLRPWEPQKFLLLTCPSRPRIASNLETAAFAMGLEQSPLLAAKVSGKDNMIDVGRGHEL